MAHTCIGGGSSCSGTGMGGGGSSIGSGFSGSGGRGGLPGGFGFPGCCKHSMAAASLSDCGRMIDGTRNRKNT
jgi:hypothetical protein